MPAYDSSYTGQQIDNAIGAINNILSSGGFISAQGVQTILGDYLTSSDAASTYLTQSDASSTYLTQTSASSTYAPKTGTLNNSGIATSWTDTWSDGTNSHPWYGLDMRYHNTGIYSTTLSNYFGLTLRTNAGYLVMNSGGNVGIGTTSPDYKLTVNGAIWIQAGSAAGSNTNRLTTTSGMPGNMQYNVGRRGVQIFSNGIAFADPYNGNTNSDAGWIRHVEETSNSGYLEIAVGDDGSEEILVRQYNTSNAVKRVMYLLNSSGFTSVSNPSDNASYAYAAMQIREENYGGSGTDSWGRAPRLAWHWSGRVAAQIGLASNGYLYEAPTTGTTFYKITYDTGSSRTIKHNIIPLPDMGDKIDLLQPVSFIYNDLSKDGIRYGLIHEDTINILPDICKFDKNQNGGCIINYIDLIPVLIKEIQSLRRRVKLLENN